MIYKEEVVQNNIKQESWKGKEEKTQTAQKNQKKGK